ncbi:hypothetical protein BS17DRAFT_809569 [Gyrodon lividus]|nr:hypothetical protein BS17DRAFT_809569 [Gyrodon lividus]
MDGISGTANVLGVIQVTAQVLITLGQYATSVHSAEASRKRLIDHITFISTAAKTVESVVQNSLPSLRSPEQEALLREWLKSDGPPAPCKKVLEYLLDWLESQVLNKGTKRMKWTSRFKWPMKEKEITAALQTFEHYMPYFRDILSITTLDCVQAMAADKAMEREQTRNNEMAAEKRKSTSCDATRKQRQKTTGEWLFAEQPYIDWCLPHSRFLWLNGKRECAVVNEGNCNADDGSPFLYLAGTGKSVLASSVIDKLSGRQTDGETVTYFYCDFRHPRSIRAKKVLRSLIVQLLRNVKTDWLPPFSDLVERKQRGAGPPADPDILSDLLQRAARLHDQPTAIIDALDECDDLSELLGALVEVNDDGYCRLFVTSRTESCIKTAFIGLPSISLTDKVETMRHAFTSTSGQSWIPEVGGEQLQEEIQDALMQMADGIEMFRWVQCQLDRLNKCRSTGDIHEVLNTLPSTLYETYERILISIDKEEFDSRVVRRALTWLVTARRPLRLSQLAAALGCKGSTNTCRRFLDICGSLVSFNEQTGIVSLSHYSVKFVHHHDAGMEVVSISVHCIMLLSSKPPQSRPGVLDFSDYAVDDGFGHLADCNPKENDSVLRLLFALHYHISNHRHQYMVALPYNGLWLAEAPQLTLHIIIRFGHLSLLHYYMNHHSVQITREDNPLVQAALIGDVSCLQALLDKGLDVNIEGITWVRGVKQSLLPLTAAVPNREGENVEDLVRVLITCRSRVPRDIIHSVIRRRCPPPVIRILLDHGADAKLLEDDGST